MSEHLSVCFIWHMHQPLYKDRMTGIYLMPWVRLHAIKDYLDMALVLKEFPRIRQTFNLVPSLIEQLEDYAWHDAVDMQLLLTIKPHTHYTADDKFYILSESFHANLERQIKPHPVYFELHQKRQRLLKRGHSLQSMIDVFSDQDYADMAAWFNLAWFDPMWIERTEELAVMTRQGNNFTVEQRRRMIEIERELMQQTMPIYKDLQQAGQIEVITSPYYHPILPLLIDTNAARLANPQSSLPKELYFHAEDAQHQLQAGVDLYEKYFKRKPRGMWPSEMAISPAALDSISAAGIDWVVLDEALLTKTTQQSIERDEHGNLNSAEMICQPYHLYVGDRTINIFFREVVLSNEISFSYAARPPQEAASAMYMRLKHIQQRLFNWQREGCVVIALDGENCWETYELDGHPFMNELYRRLSEDNTLNVCTVSDYLQRNPPTTELYNIQSGSWISADFHIWIGEPIKNRAWDLLTETRRFLSKHLAENKCSPDLTKQAWEAIYTAEGSDWFWWFGEPNNSQHDAMFDRQFRLCLQSVYKLLGQPYPPDLDIAVEDQVARDKPVVPEIAAVP